MLDIFPIPINSLQQERRIQVYLPQSYSLSQKNYPVLYMHDGQNVFRNDGAIGGISLELERYLDEKDLDVIVVAIDQNSSVRKNEYCPWENGAYSQKFLGAESLSFGGHGKQYLEFIVEELKPYIDEKYRTITNRTAMAGISMGGLISLYAACHYPKIFTDLILFSSAFYANQEKIEELVKRTDLSSINSLYMDCGTGEAGIGTSTSKEFLVSNNAVYELLRNKVPAVNFNVLEGEQHNYRSFQKRVPKLFSFLEGK
ncbi:alpha/beta hydrolase [Planococcus sp. CPCC 101016]|uniref:alpha/beta hydrolase n=1 Tax=Planococcus sp. CPCC 101016 TaxID=2599617 RepID=UPI0011B4BEFF|nr:alpha/beta hydrolase-fold protein [Planococcus sp. CPCC 101016]TWT06373.1 alpha/beta hydrolase [Planococcus sp. CPCC 101016]